MRGMLYLGCATYAAWMVMVALGVWYYKDILVVQGDRTAKDGDDSVEDWDEVYRSSCNPENNKNRGKQTSWPRNSLVLANTLGKTLFSFK